MPRTLTSEPPMDDKTAIAFAFEAFEKLHPLNLRPTWWSKSYGLYVGRDPQQNYIVHFCWKPKVNFEPVDFYVVSINAWNGQTQILLDTPLDTYSQDELEEYL